MSTENSPLGFDEFRKELKLPERMREELRKPLGKLVSNDQLQRELGGSGVIISVGDGCTLGLAEKGIEPDISIVDFKIERKDDVTLREKLSSIGTKVLRAKNPPGYLSKEAWQALSDAFRSNEKVRIEIEGEEDLVALASIVLAPSGSKVLYGLPGKGVVVVRVDHESKDRIRDILRRMEESYGD